MAEHQKVKGLPKHQTSYKSIQNGLKEKFENLLQLLGDNYIRVLPKARSTTYGCILPEDTKTKRALFLYKQALMSPDPLNQILHYSRVIEAFTEGNRHAFENLISSVKDTKLQSIWCKKTPYSYKQKKFNLINLYKKPAFKHFDIILAEKGGKIANVRQFFESLRNKAAHGGNTNDPHELIKIRSMANLYSDALLLKYLARCAIERICTNPR